MWSVPPPPRRPGEEPKHPYDQGYFRRLHGLSRPGGDAEGRGWDDADEVKRDAAKENAMKWKRLAIAVTMAVLCALGCLWSYGLGWRAGFDGGADSALCLMAHQIDGAEKAMQQRYCQSIVGMKPPLFAPGPVE
jgi:hypothetical protein